MDKKKIEFTDKTPIELNFKMLAEWEKHSATWIAWPHNPKDWPGKIIPIHWVYGEITRKISVGEIVRIIVKSKEHEIFSKRILTRVGVDLSKIEFFRFPTDRGWTRDFGPMFVKNDSETAIVRFRFNGWGKYPNYKKDDKIPELVSQKLKYPIVHVKFKNHNVVLEGGSIDVNGRGTIITTEECLLDKTFQPRNPDFDKEDIEKIFYQYLGAKNVLWLGNGIAGDDTHGHVDDICRFVGPKTVVLCKEDNPNDINYKPLEENRERLEEMKLENGSNIEVVTIPMPAPLYLDDYRLPASYANFYISNSYVIVPTFNDSKDRIALGIFSELFKDREIIGIHAVDLVWGLGTLHCLTQQQPEK
jgi:agmatine deiminase